MNTFFISCKESRIENNRSFYGCFYLGPFTNVQSLTVANALRRTLLSDCVGLGITSVTIANVKHEYSTLNGVRESVLDILLNIKEITLKKSNAFYRYKRNGFPSIYEQVGNSFFKPAIGYLKVKGPGVIRAKDLRLPPFVECVDPDQYIATLADDGFLCMKFVIMEGKGYLAQKFNNPSFGTEQSDTKKILNTHFPLHGTGYRQKLLNKIKNLKIEDNSVSIKGTYKNFANSNPLNVDTLFSPVTKVNYIIEANDNYLVDNLHTKTNFIDEISNLLESSKYMKKNFPFLDSSIHLTSNISNENLNKSQNSTLTGSPTSFDSSFSMEKEIGIHSTEPIIDKRESLLNGKSPTIEKENLFLSEIVETYSINEIYNLANVLSPIKKEEVLHTIILEIWTNGSLHPRDALKTGLNNLTSIFSNLQETHTYNSIYENTASYKRSLL